MMTIHDLSAPARLYLMPVATRSSHNVPIPCYLIQMEDGRNIVIDTGLPLDFTDSPAVSEYGPSHLGVSIVDQLAKVGLKPEQIDILICSHFDTGHAGNNALFTNAECVVQSRHYKYAHQEHDRFAGTRSQWDRPDLHYRLVEGDTELLPGVTLLDTDGHVPGHQSVLVRLHDAGPILLTIDAVPVQSLFMRDRPALAADMDAKKTRESTCKLLSVAQEERASLIIFGHDPVQWSWLKKLPEYYD